MSWSKSCCVENCVEDMRLVEMKCGKTHTSKGYWWKCKGCNRMEPMHEICVGDEFTENKEASFFKNCEDTSCPKENCNGHLISVHYRGGFIKQTDKGNWFICRSCGHEEYEFKIVEGDYEA